MYIVFIGPNSQFQTAKYLLHMEIFLHEEITINMTASIQAGVVMGS